MASATGLLIILIGSLFVITLAMITIDSMMIGEQIERNNEKITQIMDMLPEGKRSVFSDSQYITAAKQLQSIHDSNRTGYFQFTDNCSGNVYGDNEYNWGCTSKKAIGEQEAFEIIAHGLADQDRYKIPFDPTNTKKFDNMISITLTPNGICNAWENHMDRCYKDMPVAITDIYYGVSKWESFVIKVLEDGTKVYHYQPDYYVKSIKLNNGTVINGTLAQNVVDNYTKYDIKYFYIMYGQDEYNAPADHGNDLYTYEKTDSGQHIDLRQLKDLK